MERKKMNGRGRIKEDRPGGRPCSKPHKVNLVVISEFRKLPSGSRDIGAETSWCLWLRGKAQDPEGACQCKGSLESLKGHSRFSNCLFLD